MQPEREPETWQIKVGRAWLIGGEAEVAWIEDNTSGGLAITSAIPWDQVIS